jgi:hypothetical protein
MNTLQELEQFIPIERIQYLDRQEMLFEEHKGTLLRDYEGQFVAFEEGNVLDHDVQEKALAARVYRSTGTPLIRQVLAGDRRITVGGMRWGSQEKSGGVV